VTLLADFDPVMLPNFAELRDSSNQNSVPSWPGWQHDQNLAALYAPQIASSFYSGMLAAQLFLSHLVSGEIRVTPAYAAQEVSKTLAAALRTAMSPLWTEGYALGAMSARHVVSVMAEAPASTVSAAAMLTKVGKEGYIHGWVCVRPPCGKAGDAVTHPEYGEGIILDSQLNAKFNGKTGTLGSPANSSPSTTHSDIESLPPEVRAIIDDRVSRFSSRYPHAASTLSKISVAKPSDGVNDNQPAVTDRFPDGHSEILLNPLYFTNPAELQRIVDEDYLAGRHPLHSIAAVVDHELGHVIDNSHAFDGARLSDRAVWQSPKHASGLGEYSTSNSKEAFAEAFSVWEDEQQHGVPDENSKIAPEIASVMKQLRSYDMRQHTTFSAKGQKENGKAVERTCAGYVKAELVPGQRAQKSLTKLAGDPYPPLVTGPDWQNWQPGDLDAAAKVASGDRLTQLLRQWGINVIQSVSQTKLGDLAQVIASALADGKSAAALAQDITGLLNVPSRAKMIAQTEIARASSAATLDTYLDMGISTKQWLVAPDETVCKACRACEAEGAIPLSQAFLIGVDAAPAHPHCRCGLLPASVGDFDLSDMTVEPLPGFNLVPLGKSFDPLELRGHHGEWVKGSVPNYDEIGNIKATGTYTGYPMVGATVNHPVAGFGNITAMSPDKSQITATFPKAGTFSFPVESSMAYGDFKDAEPEETASVSLSSPFTPRYQMKPGEQRTITNYTKPDNDVNHRLRHLDSAVNDRQVKALDKLVAARTFTEDATLYRGVVVTPALRESMKPGYSFTDQAYTSLSDKASAAKDFAEFRATGKQREGNLAYYPEGSTPALMLVHVRAGTHTAQGDEGLGEYITPRNMKFTVNGVSDDGRVFDVSAEETAPVTQKSARQRVASFNGHRLVHEETDGTWLPPAGIRPRTAGINSVKAANKEHKDTVICDHGHKHKGKYGAAGILARAPRPTGEVAYLLQQRNADADCAGKWGTFGGGLHAGETPLEGATREVNEETGNVHVISNGLEPVIGKSNDDILNVKPVPTLQVSHSYIDDHGGWAYTTFVADCAATFWPSFDGETPEESADWGWFTPEEMRHVKLHPGFKAALPKLLAGIAAKSASRGIIFKVGPEGYIHGWVYVGPAAGGKITHPEHGVGTVAATSLHGTTVPVSYPDGKVRIYQARKDESAAPHLEMEHQAGPGEPLRGTTARLATPGKYDVDTPIGYRIGEKVTGDKARRKAVREYAANGFTKINGELRLASGDLGKVEEKRPDVAKQISAIDDAEAASPLSHAIETWRGVENGKEMLGAAWRDDSSMVGASWIDDGFGSTSTQRDIATTFNILGAGSGNGAVFRLSVPVGIHAISVGDDGDSDENEILLDRGLQYTITGDLGKDEDGSRQFAVAVSQP
jgi:8-oxo-dGTP diphosphatase